MSATPSNSEPASPERISDAELDVMEVLWDRSPLTAAEVSAAIAPRRNWTLQTVKTLLSRLAAKAVVDAERDGRRFLYTPLVARETYVSGLSHRFVERMFGGRVSPLVAQLAESDGLSDEDIAEIEQLLKELKR